MLLQGATVTSYRMSDDAVVASVVASDGTYSLPLLGVFGYVVDGYVRATLSEYVDGYVFPTLLSPRGDLTLVTPDDLITQYNAAGTTQNPTAGTILEKVHSPTGAYDAWGFNASVGSFTATASPPPNYHVVYDKVTVKVFANALSTVILDYGPAG
jgi:hypothetical protein